MLSDPYGLLGGASMEELNNMLNGLTISAVVEKPVENSLECKHCKIPLTRNVNNIEYNCNSCGLVIEGDSAEPDADEATDPIKMSTQ